LACSSPWGWPRGQRRDFGGGAGADAGAEVIGFLEGYANLENYDPAKPLVEGKHICG
jgi:hypothetical protein